MREFNWQRTNEKYGAMLSPTAVLESAFEKARHLHYCADKMHAIPPEKFGEVIRGIRELRVINREEEDELNALFERKGTKAVVKELRKAAEQHEAAAKKMSGEIDWPRKSHYRELSDAERRAVISGMLTATRVLGEKRPKLRVRSVLSRMKFEQDTVKQGKHDAAGQYNDWLKDIKIGKRSKLKARGINNVKAHLANTAAHETAHKLGFPDAITSAIGYYTGFQQGQELPFLTRFTDYSREQIIGAREPPLERQNDRNDSNAYYLGWLLGTEAKIVESRSENPHAGIEYLRNLAKGMGSKEAREAVCSK